jgi:hypothetical protein
MSTVVDSARDRLRARRAAPAAPPWRFPAIGDFYQALPVLAFDATLSHCGWVLLEVQDRVIVHARGCINPRTQRRSYLETWDKAHQLQSEIDWILKYRETVHRVVEAPSVAGGNRTESSLIAGMMIWMNNPQLCDTVSATHVSAVLLGDPRVRSADRKKQVRDAVIRLIPGAAGRGWNEHIRDAAATGLTYLHDEALRTPQRPYRTGDPR